LAGQCAQIAEKRTGHATIFQLMVILTGNLNGLGTRVAFYFQVGMRGRVLEGRRHLSQGGQRAKKI
jgi:hypothetical protein